MAKKKQNRSEWIRSALEDNGYDIGKVVAMYPDHVKTYPDASQTSYVVSVRREAKLIEQTGKNMKKYANLSHDTLMNKLYEWIKKAGTILSIKEIKRLADAENIQYTALTTLARGSLNKLITEIYKELFEKTPDHEAVVYEYEQRLANAQREKNQILSELNVEKKVFDMFKETFENIKVKPKRIEIVKPVIGTRTGFLHLSDIHFSQIIDAEEVRYLNEYNESIAQDRLAYIFKETCKSMQEMQTNELFIFLGGDLLSGDIHDELSETNESVITDSVSKLALIISSHIHDVAKHFKVRVVCVSGNHARIHMKPRYKKASKLNWEYMMYKFIQHHVGAAVDEFTIPNRKFEITNIQGYNFYLCHGEDIGSGSGGFASLPNTAPRDYSQIAAMHRHKQSKDPVDVDYFVQGHLHTPGEMPTYELKEIIYNGSLCGPDEYAINRVKRATPASQNFFIVEKGEGKKYLRKLECSHIRQGYSDSKSNA